MQKDIKISSNRVFWLHILNYETKYFSLTLKSLKPEFFCNTGKPAPDDAKLSALNVKEGMKIMMMGSQEEKLVRFYYKVLDTTHLPYYVKRSILIALPTCVR